MVARRAAGARSRCRVLLDPGDAAWIEEPGYPGARGALARGGRAARAGAGRRRRARRRGGRARGAGARLVYVTPSHQFPLGVTMSLARRLALLDWAARARRVDARGRLRQRVPLRRAARSPRCRASTRDGARDLRRHVQQGAVPVAARSATWSCRPTLVDAVRGARAPPTGHASPSSSRRRSPTSWTRATSRAHIRRMRALYAERQVAWSTAAPAVVSTACSTCAPPTRACSSRRLLPARTDDRARRRAPRSTRASSPPRCPPITSAPLRPPGLFLGYAGVRERDIARGVERLATVLERGGAVARPMLGRRLARDDPAQSRTGERLAARHRRARARRHLSPRARVHRAARRASAAAAARRSRPRGGFTAVLVTGSGHRGARGGRDERALGDGPARDRRERRLRRAHRAMARRGGLQHTVVESAWTSPPDLDRARARGRATPTSRRSPSSTTRRRPGSEPGRRGRPHRARARQAPARRLGQRPRRRRARPRRRRRRPRRRHGRQVHPGLPRHRRSCSCARRLARLAAHPRALALPLARRRT